MILNVEIESFLTLLFKVQIPVCVHDRYPHVSGNRGAENSPLPAQRSRVLVGLEQKNFSFCAGYTLTLQLYWGCR